MTSKHGMFTLCALGGLTLGTITGGLYSINLIRAGPAAMAMLIAAGGLVGSALGCSLGLRSERRPESNPGCFAFLVGLLASLIPVTLAALSGLREAYLWVPLAGLLSSAAASRSGLTPVLGIALAVWLSALFWLSRLGAPRLALTHWLEALVVLAVMFGAASLLRRSPLPGYRGVPSNL